MLDDNNYNLSKHEKELLLWHYRLGHAGFAWIQTLMRQRKPTAHGIPKLSQELFVFLVAAEKVWSRKNRWIGSPLPKLSSQI